MGPCSRGREVPCGVLLSSPKTLKRSIFCHRRGIENFCRPNVFVSDAWPAPAAYHRPLCEHCYDHRSDFMAQSLFFSIDICRGLVISPLRINIWWSFLRTILAQHLPRNYCFRFFLRSSFSWELFFGRFFVLIASGTKILWRVSLKLNFVLATSRFHCYRSTLPYV